MILPELYKMWKSGDLKEHPESLLACPCQWEDNLGTYKLIEGDKLIAVDLHAWHPSGRLGLTVEGDVIVVED